MLKELIDKYLVNPGVRVESNRKADGEKDAGIPVDQDEDLDDDLGDPEGVGKVGSRLCFVEELEHPVDPSNPVESEDDWTGEVLMAGAIEEKIGEIGGEQTEHVKLEPEKRRRKNMISYVITYE